MPSTEDTDAVPGPHLTSRLGYLLKRSMQQLSALTTQALEPFGFDDRRLAVLLLLADSAPLSQQQAAERLGIDRSTMVLHLDALAAQGLVTRHPDPADRRRNVVLLTDVGRDTVKEAVAACEEAERALLAPVDEPSRIHLRETLSAVERHARSHHASA
ncbi:MarR family winged helix-turn-helix transcriptional regulator [Actinoallomurus iriomotensis]|uniref:MarR family transcriptional regulator n=1 Tax=Actinoallomurus iriomotensis TaxID=478107 RepID=A0A9W6S2L5_9ACTN|nr:MarR family winged helix-turn-helix transcriptional regulator [Actinoallomurus iriomotensis]GLY86101.1 MarR family transcriptional regulator [Actinoallomurus iriomotensis]